MTWLDLTDHLLPEFWGQAFDHGLRCQIILEGRYHPPTDLDLLLMYCMGDPI